MNKLVQDYLKFLGLSNSCSKEDIKKSYRILANKFHPDKNLDKKNTANDFIKAKKASDYLLANFDEIAQPVETQTYNYKNYNQETTILNVSLYDSFNSSVVYCHQLRASIKLPPVYHNQTIFIDVLDKFNIKTPHKFNIKLFDPKGFYTIKTIKGKFYFGC